MGLLPVSAVFYDPATSSARPHEASFDWETYFYLIAQLVGGVGLSVLLITLVWPSNKRRPRNPLLISLCFSWWLSTFPCLCILYYAGQVTGPSPTFSVCLASASLTLAQSIMVAFTGPALILHIWLVVRTALSPRFVHETCIRRTIMICLIIPYALFITAALVALYVGLKRPQHVYRVKFYCIVENDALTKVASICGLVFVGGAIILEAWTVWLLYRNRVIIKHLSREGIGLDVALVLRVCIFGLYVFLGLCLEVLSLFRWTSSTSDIFFSTFSIAVFSVFGTQPETWQIWQKGSRKAGQTLSRMSVQLQPRPSPRHLVPMISSSCPSSRYPLTTPSMCSQRQTSFIPSSRPLSTLSGFTRQSEMLPYDPMRHQFYPPLPSLPPPPARYGARCRPSETTSLCLTPALTNNDQRTPTSPFSPDPGAPFTDHTKKFDDLKGKPSVYPLSIDLAQPPSAWMDQHDFDATTLDARLVGPIHEVFPSTDPAMHPPPRQVRMTDATAYSSHAQGLIGRLHSDVISPVLPTAQLNPDGASNGDSHLPGNACI